MNITFQLKNGSEPATSDSQKRASALSTDFSEARHQLMLESRHAGQDKAARAAKNGTGQLEAHAGFSGLLEEAVYWFLTAPALAYVVYSACGF